MLALNGCEVYDPLDLSPNYYTEVLSTLHKIPDLLLLMDGTTAVMDSVHRISATKTGGVKGAWTEESNFQDLLGFKAPAVCEATDNLLSEEDSSFEGGTVGDWYMPAYGTLSNSSAWAAHGSKCLRITYDGSGSANIMINPGIGVLAPGNTYTISAEIKNSSSVTVAVGLYDNVSGWSVGNTIAAGGVGRSRVTKTINSGATQVRASCAYIVGTPTAGQYIEADAVQIENKAYSTPFALDYRTATTCTFPTAGLGLQAGQDLTIVVVARRVADLLGSTAYEFLNCVANNAGFRLRMENSTLRWERMNGTAGRGKLYNTQIGADTPVIVVATANSSCDLELVVNGTEATADCTPYGSGNDQFNNPTGVATDGTYLYVADQYNHRIVKRLCSDLSYVAKIGSQGSGNDQFNYPTGVATDGTHIYAVDRYNHRIVKRLCSDLSYVAKIGSQGSSDDQFNYPAGVTTDGTYLYVADRLNHRIVKRLASDLSYVAKVGGYGSGNDQFNNPTGVATDGTYLYVADQYNHRIVKRTLALAYSRESPRATSWETSLPATLSLPNTANAPLLVAIFKRVLSDREIGLVSRMGAWHQRMRGY